MTGDNCVIIAYVIGLGAIAFCAVKLWLDLRGADSNKSSDFNSGGVS